MNTSRTRKIAMVSIMGALAYLLMFFSFPVIPAFPFLKVDFSDVPILIATFATGPLGGTAAALIRTILHYIQTGGDMGIPIGDFASFSASVSYVLAFYYASRAKVDQKSLLKGSTAGTLSLTVILSLLNAFVLFPFYTAVMGLDLGPTIPYVFGAVVPFNLIKGIIVSVAASILLPKILKHLPKIK